MTHLHTLLVSALTAVATFGAATASAAPSIAPPPAHSGMKPGSWEIVSEITSSDSSSKRTVTSRLCYGPEDVAVPARVLPPQRGLGVQCLATDIKRGADGVAWKLACRGKAGALDGSATMKAGPTSYVAQASLGRKAGGKAVTVQEQINARWVGECT